MDYQCNLCPFIPENFVKLNLHLKKHLSQKKMVKCICSKYFKSFSRYYEHLTRDHKEELKRNNKTSGPQKLRSQRRAKKQKTSHNSISEEQPQLNETEPMEEEIPTTVDARKNAEEYVDHIIRFQCQHNLDETTMTIMVPQMIDLITHISCLPTKDIILDEMKSVFKSRYSFNSYMQKKPNYVAPKLLPLVDEVNGEDVRLDYYFIDLVKTLKLYTSDSKIFENLFSKRGKTLFF